VDAFRALRRLLQTVDTQGRHAHNLSRWSRRSSRRYWRGGA